MPISFADVRYALVALVAGVAGCADAPAEPRPAAAATCDGQELVARTPAPMTGLVLAGADAACFALAGDGPEYLVVPQLAGASLPYGSYSFRLGAPDAPGVSRPVTALATLAPADPPGAAERLHAVLRAAEMRATAPDRPPHPVATRVHGGGQVDSLRSFSVLNTLSQPATFASVRARLLAGGTRVLLYVDTAAVATVPSATARAMTDLFDRDLIPAMQAAFGDGSDLDGNGRIIVLLSPVVNALVRADQCAINGFVRGFFNSHDLSSTESTSNRGEIFYAYVPDETGRWSCPHTRADVVANLPPTFVHELQHLISFGEHAVERGGAAEEPWLNEGLSHLAEELGARVFEARYPSPLGRTAPTQLFPDSAGPFITPSLLYSYRHLFVSNVHSLTACAPGTFCSLPERGGVWLFLRWIIDQQGESITRQLVETRTTGRQNLEAAAGRTMASLLGQFALAVSVDSVPGQPRSAVPPALRFATRVPRRLYRGLFDAFGITGGVSRPFPIEPLTLTPGSTTVNAMRPGTFVTYRLRTTGSGGPVVLAFRGSDGAMHPASAGAQVSVFRLP